LLIFVKLYVAYTGILLSLILLPRILFPDFQGDLLLRCCLIAQVIPVQGVSIRNVCCLISLLDPCIITWKFYKLYVGTLYRQKCHPTEVFWNVYFLL